MNAQHWAPTSGVNGLRSASHLGNDSKTRARVVVLGSFIGGYHVLSELIFGELALSCARARRSADHCMAGLRL